MIIAKHHSVSKYSGIRWKIDSFLKYRDYADDICLLSHSALDAANMLYSLENEAASFGVKINTAKTKSMSIVNSSTTRQPRPNAIVLNGHPVKEINQFTYLGCEICKDGGSDADVTLTAESGRLRERLEYCHQFGEIIHFQTALKFAYLKAMSYQFCCMVQALGKSPNELPPNFKSL